MVIGSGYFTIKEMWAEVRKIQSGLPDTVALVSIPANSPGCNPDERARVAPQWIEADSLTAAQCIFAGTHRLATEEEAVKESVKRQASIQETTRQYLASKGIVSMVLPNETSE